jgi:hypothetical protein
MSLVQTKQESCTSEHGTYFNFHASLEMRNAYKNCDGIKLEEK